MKTEAEQLTLAKDAVHHVLNAIADDPRKYWLMGNGTESYAKLTAAAAALWDRPLANVRENFQPLKEPYDRWCAEREAHERLLTYCRENGITAPPPE